MWFNHEKWSAWYLGLPSRLPTFRTISNIGHFLAAAGVMYFVVIPALEYAAEEMRNQQLGIVSDSKIAKYERRQKVNQLCIEKMHKAPVEIDLRHSYFR